jgi:hypothetical protein
MALTKEIILAENIEIHTEFKILHCRDTTIVKENGVELSRSSSRHSLIPSTIEQNEDGSFTHTDTDISGETQETQDICAVVWTDAVKAAFKTFNESKPEFSAE